MSNIVWKRPDNTLAITRLTPEALARMAWANAPENQALLADKIVVVAERSAVASALEWGAEQIARREAARAALDGDVKAAVADENDNSATALTAELEAAAAQVDEASAAQVQREKDLAAIDAKLATIAEVEWVRDNIGLDEHGHELVLQRNGQVPADHVCVGHALELPADRKYRAAWTCVGGVVVVDPQKKIAVDRDDIKRQLDALDEASRTTRPSRDVVILQAAQLPGAAKKAQVVEATAAVLRAQLAALG